MIGRGPLVIAVIAALAGCAADVPFPRPVAVPVPVGAPVEGAGVERALTKHSWKVIDRGPGVIRAVVFSGTREQASIDVVYGPGVLVIRCVTAYVDRDRYYRWIEILSAELRANVVPLAMPPPIAIPAPL